MAHTDDGVTAPLAPEVQVTLYVHAVPPDTADGDLHVLCAPGSRVDEVEAAVEVTSRAP